MSDYYKHPTAVVENALIGKGSKIWHFSHIRQGAVIGENCTIGKDVFIDENVILGTNVKIQNGVSVYKGVQLEDNVFVGPNVTFTNDLRPRSYTKEGWEVIPTLVKNNASIGANTTIICGVVIEEYSMIGAGSMLTTSTLPHGLYIGNPARFKGFVNENGKPMTEVGGRRISENIYEMIYSPTPVLEDDRFFYVIFKWNQFKKG